MKESWAHQVPSGFMFAVKAPQIITHIKRLKNVSEETRYFLTVLAGLGKKLGPVLFQFPASFRQDIPLLENFLELIPLITNILLKLFGNNIILYLWMAEGNTIKNYSG